jgi:hypothetical protein
LYRQHYWRISLVLSHCRGFYNRPVPAAGTGRVTVQFIMIAGSFIDDTVFGIAKRAGKADDIPGSRARNFRFYRMVFHWNIRSCNSRKGAADLKREMRSSCRKGLEG